MIARASGMRKFVTWLWWRAHYICRPTPKSLEGYLLRGMRTRWPWRKFRPSVWRNDDGRQWHVYLADEQSFTERRHIVLECAIGMESGDIVGFIVWDSTLRERTALVAGESK